MKLKLVISLYALLLGQSSCKNDQTSKAVTSQEQAVKAAEIFVRNNGYTLYPADKSNLSYELFDGAYANDDTVLYHRHNSLHPKAYFISEDSSTWYIGFVSSRVDTLKLSVNQKQNNLSGRAVIVEKNGREIRMEHKDPLFSYFKKL